MNPAKWVSSEAADYPKGISISLYPNTHFLQLPKERRRSLGMCFLPTKCPLPDKVKSWMQNFLWIWDNDSKTENRKKNWNYPIKGDTNDNFLSLPCFWVYRKKKKEKKNYTSLHNLQLRAGFYMDLRYEFMLWEYSKNKQSK